MKKILSLCCLFLICSIFLPMNGFTEENANITSLKEIFELLETDVIGFEQCDYNKGTPEDTCWENGVEGGKKTLAVASSGLSLNNQGVASTLSIGSHGATEVTWRWSEKNGQIIFTDGIGKCKIYKNRYLVASQGDTYMLSNKDYAKVLKKLKAHSQEKKALRQSQSSYSTNANLKGQPEQTRANIAKQMQLNDEILQKALKEK